MAPDARHGQAGCAADRPGVIDGDDETIEDVGPTGGCSLHGRYTRGSEARDYDLYVPACGAPPRPLLLMLHGCQQDAADVARLTRFNRLADELGFIVLYPTQSRTTNATGCWNWFLPDHRRPGEGEAALLAALTQDVAVRYGADPKRLYVA